MHSKAKLLLSALGLVALAATPATAKKQHARTDRIQAEHVASPIIGWEGAYAYEPGYRPPAQPGVRLPTSFGRYDGYQHDRQLVGLGYQ